jgi:SusD family
MSSKQRLAILAAATLGLAGCESQLDELLAVERPGQLPVEALNSPALIPPLVNGVQSDFECAYSVYIDYFGLWSGELNHGNARMFQVEQRNAPNVTLYERSCEGGSYANSGFSAMHMTRSQAQTAIDLINGFTDAQVPNKPGMLGRSQLYQAYATLFLSEGFCAYTEEGGPVVSREQGFRLAEERFTKTLEYAAQVTDASLARQLRNAALIGRARARLSLWSLGKIDAAAVVQDASQVADGFVFYGNYESGAGARRSNNMYSTDVQGKGFISPLYRSLRFLGNVPDPRLPIVETRVIPTGTALRGWAAQKFRSEGDDMPIGTWREAMLMIAEVQGGQAAVNIINQIRAQVARAPYVPAGTYNLPMFSSSDPVAIQAEVRKERMRETFLMGTRMGDLMRWAAKPLAAPFDAWPSGVPERGNGQFNMDYTCRPFPDYEVYGNPNIDEVIPYPVQPL